MPIWICILIIPDLKLWVFMFISWPLTRVVLITYILFNLFILFLWLILFRLSGFFNFYVECKLKNVFFFPGTEPHSLQLSRVGVRLFRIKDLKTKSRTNFEQPFRSVCDKNFYTTVYSDSIVFWKRLCQNRMK